jgi:hypothetical protein
MLTATALRAGCGGGVFECLAFEGIGVAAPGAAAVTVLSVAVG